MANITVGQPTGIYVQIKDTVAKKSRAFTVHGMSFDKLFYKIKFYIESMANFEDIKLVCYKKEEK